MIHQLRGPLDGIMRVVGRALGATGIHPNALTLVGLALNWVAAVVVWMGWLPLGGAIFLFASAFDMLDGAVARAMGTASRFGAFFDSMIDRYAEAGVLVALIAYFAGAGESVFALGSALALVGSLLVSYARARAEGLGVDCEVGILQRPERVVLLGIGLLFPDLLLAPVVWGLAAVANATAVQRILHVRRLLSQASPPSAP